MNEVWVGVIGALVASGVVILHAEWQTWRTKSNQDEAVRRMLWVEIERNLELARELDRFLKTNTTNPLTVNSLSHAPEWSRTFVSAPFLAFSHDVWTANLDKEADAVGLNQAHLVFRHHGHISMLREQYKVVTRMYSETQPSLSDHVGRVRKMVVSELDALIALGNPTEPLLEKMV